jgi:tetratricopeptide (TPR) repeat protein
MNSLAASLAFDESRRDESVALFEEVLEIRLRTLGREHPRTLNTLNMVGRMYELQGRTEEALALMTESVETGRRVLPRDHWFLGLFLRRQGACLAALHRLPEAEAALQEGQRILELEIGHEAEAQRARRDLAQVREAMSKEAAPPE